ncbi:hypothetical protein ACJRO7_026471 [Eucalyptus globulus]|uniref:Uncharacterized protein n=1 Tax=Eucalyptus globulus TaxID=34317 RepID=A0ABD3JQQ4_EUCGL
MAAFATSGTSIETEIVSMSVKGQTMQFLYTGNRITSNQTPQQHHLKFIMYFVITYHCDWRIKPKSALLSTSWKAEDSSTDKSRVERTFLLCFFKTSNEIETI